MHHDIILATTQRPPQPYPTHDPYADEVIDLMADLMADLHGDRETITRTTNSGFRLKQLIPIRSRLSMPELLHFFKARAHMDRFAGCRDSG